MKTYHYLQINITSNWMPVAKLKITWLKYSIILGMLYNELIFSSKALLPNCRVRWISNKFVHLLLVHILWTALITLSLFINDFPLFYFYNSELPVLANRIQHLPFSVFRSALLLKSIISLARVESQPFKVNHKMNAHILLQ